MATKRPSEKNTKAEILAAFDELLKEKKALETETKEPKPEPKPKTPPMLAPPQNMTSVIESLDRLQLNFGSAISDLSEKLTLEATKLQDLQQSVSTEVEQLQTLHNLQLTEDSLDTLIQQYGDSFKTFTNELNQRRQTINQELTQSKKAWTKEQDDHRRSIKERNEILNKNRQRDGKEYIYALTLQRKLSNEDFEQEKKRLYQEISELRETRQKEWEQREKAIADRETQFTELKTKVEAFPQQLESALKRAKEEGKGIAAHQAKVKADLAAKDIEGQKRSYEIRLQALMETLQNQESRIQSLSDQLSNALKQVQDLAVKAIEGASNVSSAQMFKEIAIEQAKTQNKNK